MKRFYIAILMFMLPIFVFMGGAEFGARQIPNYYSYKYNWMDKHAEEVETLVLGSSHSLNGIIPRYLGENSFNLALPGQTIKYDAYLFFKWADRYKNLKLVILPISYFSFFIDHSEWIGETYSKIYLKSPFHSDFSRYNLEMLDFKSLHSKIYLWRTEDDIYIKERGWLPMYLKNKNISTWNLEHINIHGVKEHTIKSWEFVDNNYKLVSSIIEYCQKNGIKITLITTPQYKDYNIHLDKAQLNKMYELINNLQRTYGVLYLNYLQDDRFYADDFYDPSHLSEIGAEKFTKILKHDIIKN